MIPSFAIPLLRRTQSHQLRLEPTIFPELRLSYTPEYLLQNAKAVDTFDEVVVEIENQSHFFHPVANWRSIGPSEIFTIQGVGCSARELDLTFAEALIWILATQNYHDVLKPFIRNNFANWHPSILRGELYGSTQPLPPSLSDQYADWGVSMSSPFISLSGQLYRLGATRKKPWYESQRVREWTPNSLVKFLPSLVLNNS